MGSYDDLLSNVHIFLSELSRYYISEVGISDTSFHWKQYIDAHRIANRSEAHLSALVELVLSAAIQSSERDSFVAPIMELPEEAQEVLMAIIQEHMAGDDDVYHNGSVARIAGCGLSAGPTPVTPARALEDDGEVDDLRAERDALVAELETARAMAHPSDDGRVAELQGEIDAMYERHAATDQQLADTRRDLEEALAANTQVRADGETLREELEALRSENRVLREKAESREQTEVREEKGVDETEAESMRNMISELEKALAASQASAVELKEENQRRNEDLEAHKKALTALKASLASHDTDAADRARRAEDEALMVAGAFHSYVVAGLGDEASHLARVESGQNWWNRLRVDRRG